MITDDGIKNMKLHTLYIYGNTKITNSGIKNMGLVKIYCDHNNRIVKNKTNNNYRIVKIMIWLIIKVRNIFT